MLGVFLDTETNGLDWNTSDVLEIAFVIVDLSSGQRLTTYSTLIQTSSETWSQSSPRSLSFTGITFQELVLGKSKSTVKKELLQIFKKFGIYRGKAVFICQNPTFDRIFFAKLIDPITQDKKQIPYNWLDLASMYWAKQVSLGAPLETIELSKDKIAKAHNIPPESMPHRALQGVHHLILCYEEVVGFPAKTTALI